MESKHATRQPEGMTEISNGPGEVAGVHADTDPDSDPSTNPGTGPSALNDDSAGPSSDRDNEQKEEPKQSSTRRSRHHRRRSKGARQVAKLNRSVRNLKIALTTVIMVLTTAVVIGKRYQDQLSFESAGLQRKVDSLQERLAKEDTLNKKLLADMDAMVESRLPGLRKMELDQVIPISQQYVKNLIFVVSKDGTKTTYDYTLVVFNANSTPVIARTILRLFNDRGIEIGNTNITDVGEANDGLKRSLSPGEIRSYSGSASVSGQAEPAYFLLDIK